MTRLIFILFIILIIITSFAFQGGYAFWVERDSGFWGWLLLFGVIVFFPAFLGRLSDIFSP